MDNKKDIAAKNRKLMRQSTWIILFALVIMGGLTLFVIDKSPTLRETLEKERPVDRETETQLAVFEKMADGQFNPISGEVKPRAELVFTLSSNVPVHVALLAVMDSLSPRIIFEDTRIPPGRDKRLDKAGDRFIFKIRAGQRNMRFCLVKASNSTDLLKKLLRPKNIWNRVPEKQCVSVTVAAE